MNVIFINTELEVQSTLAGPIGQGFDSPVEKVSSAIEYGLRDPMFFGSLRQHFSQGFADLLFPL